MSATRTEPFLGMSACFTAADGNRVPAAPPAQRRMPPVRVRAKMGWGEHLDSTAPAAT